MIASLETNMNIGMNISFGLQTKKNVRICKVCGVEKELNHFFLKDKTCRECQNEIAAGVVKNTIDDFLLKATVNYDLKAYKKLKYSREYYKKNRLEKIEKQKVYNRTLKGKLSLLKKYQKKATGKLTEFDDLTTSDIEWLENFYEFCPSCGEDIRGMYSVDHKLPTSKGGHLTKNNLQLLCKSCNSKKHDKEIDFLSQNHKNI
jgi:5-methylcytosine-specific restriction endonuclease McrA